MRSLLLLPLVSICFILLSSCGRDEKRAVGKPSEQEVVSKSNQDSINIGTPEITKNDSNQNVKKLKDSTAVLFFKDLSNVYNYKIIDKHHGIENQYHYDSVSRVIKIFDKKDSLIQKLRIGLEMGTWYPDDRLQLRPSRSYITGKNMHFDDVDNYCGEIVVADLNFDGLEDFATPTSSGTDNGPHYSFYVQDTHHRFKLNRYLTDNVTWFPERIVDSLRIFTTDVPCTVEGTMFQTFRYDEASTRWRRIEYYFRNNRTGEIHALPR